MKEHGFKERNLYLGRRTNLWVMGWYVLIEVYFQHRKSQCYIPLFFLELVVAGCSGWRSNLFGTHSYYTCSVRFPSLRYRAGYKFSPEQQQNVLAMDTLVALRRGRLGEQLTGKNVT